MHLLNLNTTAKLPPEGKEYMCFHIGGKSAQADNCVNSNIITKLVCYVIYIDAFEQKCVLIKGVLKSPHIREHVGTVGIDQL